MSRHIFIDNSNIYGGAMVTAENVEPGAIHQSIRVYYRNLFELLERPGGTITRMMAGSVPPGNDELWEYANRGGYDTHLLRKVRTDDGRIREQAVDEMLHLKIANALLDFRPPPTLVLVTGDGRDTEFGNSFTRQAERALDHGWEVEVWSWRACLSGRFSRLASPTGRHVQICELDQYYRSITFVQDGHYEIQGVTLNIGGRVVSPLPRAV